MCSVYKTSTQKGLYLALMLLLSGLLSAYRKDLIFTSVGVKEGLSQNMVNIIMKDRKGFMWFTTLDGLNRYDGLSFTILRYQVDNPESLSNSTINSLFEDSEGYLWVGTGGGGLNRLDKSVHRFRHYRHITDDPNSIRSDTVISICQDRHGNLWVATDQGLDCLVARDERFIHYLHDSKDQGSIAGSVLDFVLTDLDGRLWIGLKNMGVDRFDPDSGHFTHYRHDQKNERTLTSNVGTASCRAPDGMIWIGHEQGRLSRLDPRTGWVSRYVLDEKIPRIVGLTVDRSGNVWAATLEGIFYLNPVTGEKINIRSNPRVPATLSDNNVTCIYVDDTDILWAGVSNYGVNKCNLKAKRFVNYIHDPTNPDTLSFDFVRGIYENKNGLLYIGSEGKFDCYDPNKEEWKHFTIEMPKYLPSLSLLDNSFYRGMQNPTVYCICPNSDDPNDFLWLGTSGASLATFDQKRQKIIYNPINGFRGRMVYGLYRDPGDILWASTNEGLNRYDLKKKINQYIDLRQFTSRGANSGKLVDVNLVVPDRNGILWVGSTEDGIFSYDAQTNKWSNYSHDPKNPNSLSHNRIPTILETREGELWIGTYGGGLNRFDRKSGIFERFTTRRGLPNDIVYGMVEDKEGQLWISSNLGLCRFNPKTGVFRSYTDKDGLIINEFNSQSYHKSRWSGKIYFGGIKGVTVFDPSEVLDDPHPPSVVIEDFKIFNRSIVPGPRSLLKKPISETDSLSLSYRDSMLTFEFNALHYVAPVKNRFAYFLEGFDQQWNMTDAQRRYATYTNLNPGQYTLRVKAANCDGVWNETGKTLKIYIAPPFWKTWWFTLFAGISLALTLFLFYHYRVRGLKKRKTELEKLVVLRTQELREMSLRDPLTGLRNRRFITEILKTELLSFVNAKKHLLTHRYRRNENSAATVFGVFMIDIDRFKAVNDSYSHEVGDQFLMQLSNLLCDSIREDDVVVRMGGEEFLIVLKKTNPDFMSIFAKKLKDRIEVMDFTLENDSGGILRRTCSIGFASFPFYPEKPEVLNFDQVVTLADLGMIHGKKSGRNVAVHVIPGGKNPDPGNICGLLSSLENGLNNQYLTIEIIK